MEHACIKKKLKATDILAVQMLKFIGSFYWLYKALNIYYEYKSIVHDVHVKVWYRKMCSFVVLCVDETYYFICNKTTQILAKSVHIKDKTIKWIVN